MLTIYAIAFAAFSSAAGHEGASTATSPKVVSTLPAAGTAVPGGAITLRVTFDRPMRPGSYSFVRKSRETYPDCGRTRPEQSADRRSFTLPCKVEAGRSYEIWFNSPPYMNFVGEDGTPAEPHRLLFRAR